MNRLDWGRLDGILTMSLMISIIEFCSSSRVKAIKIYLIKIDKVKQFTFVQLFIQ